MKNEHKPLQKPFNCILYEVCLYPILIYLRVLMFDVFGHFELLTCSWNLRLRWNEVLLRVYFYSFEAVFVISAVRATNCGPVCGSQMCSFQCNLRYFSIFREAVPQIVVRPQATISGVFYVIRIIYRLFPGICATRRGPNSDFRLCLVASVRTTTWSVAAIEYLVWWTTILV